MRRAGIQPGSKHMQNSPMARMNGLPRSTKTQKVRKPDARPKTLKSKERHVTEADHRYWDRLANEIGCIACYVAGRPTSNYVSIHHIEGRVKEGCHQLVLPLCAGCHQHGTGNDKSLVAIHPYQKRFEKLYGTELELKARCDLLLGVTKK